jgi:hypothetical protein
VLGAEYAASMAKSISCFRPLLFSREIVLRVRVVALGDTFASSASPSWVGLPVVSCVCLAGINGGDGIYSSGREARRGEGGKEGGFAEAGRRESRGKGRKGKNRKLRRSRGEVGKK